MKNIMIIGMLFISMSFAITGTDVVIDNKTKLEWQNQPINKTKEVDWLSAINYCEDLELMGKNDWRLPNINELRSLMDYTNGSIISTLKDTTSTGVRISTGIRVSYWSSTTFFDSKDGAYIVEFQNGSSNTILKSYTYTHVRCVRDN